MSILGTRISPLIFCAALLWPVVGPGGRAAETKPLRPGEEALGPWWMRQTALSSDGRLATLKTRRWWKKAVGLKPGESAALDVGGEAKDRMTVRREKTVSPDGHELSALVWVIDDDADGSVQSGGDRDSDCYVIDLNADGLVDRMVDFIDNDGDNRADEADIRVFGDGALSFGRFGVDLDCDGLIWDFASPADIPAGQPRRGGRGDGLYFANKFDPARGVWIPLGECPLLFMGASPENAVATSFRVAVVPGSADPAKNPDAATGAAALPFEKSMTAPVIAGIQAGYEIEPGNGVEMSVHLAGHTPHALSGPARFNPKRRPPQETVVLSIEAVRGIAESYEAREAGFSWRESSDESVPPESSLLPWVWERRFMDNAGGPTEKWNIRREWMGKPSSKREFYYSGVDRRVHLLGAGEGWIQIGHFAGLGPLGELRMSDTDGNGIFDRWEFYLTNSSRPVRVTQVRDEKARPIDPRPESIRDLLVKEVLPEAAAENEKVLAAMNGLRPIDAPAGLRAACAHGSAGRRRYAADILRELAYLGLHDYLSTLANQTLFRDAGESKLDGFWGDLDIVKGAGRAKAASEMDSRKAWRLVRLLRELDFSYGQGDYARVVELLKDIGEALTFP